VIVMYALMQAFTQEVFRTTAPQGQSTPKIKKRK